MVEEEVVAVVGEVVVAAEEDLVHLSQLRGVDANEDIQDIGKCHRHIQSRYSIFHLSSEQGNMHIRKDYLALILGNTAINCNKIAVGK